MKFIVGVPLDASEGDCAKGPWSSCFPSFTVIQSPVLPPVFQTHDHSVSQIN